MIRDNEIENIIRKNEHDMDICSDVLIKAACDAEGADNITICICQILQGGGICNPQVFEAFDKKTSGPDQKSSRISDIISTKITGNGKKWNKIIITAIVALLASAVVLGILFKKSQFFNHNNTNKTDSTEVVTTETISTQTIVATDGRLFVVEREEGDPQVGDRAYPDGTYMLDPKTTVVIKDSIVVSINSKDDFKNPISEEKIGSEESKKLDKKNKSGKKGSGIFDDLPKEEETQEVMPRDNGSADGGSEGKLTPIDGTVYIDKVHEVKVDETLFSIGKKYGITPDEIRRLNPSVAGNTIKPGDKLRIRYIKIK
jgi:LysM repeat protein